MTQQVNVLIVDDNPNVRITLKNVLSVFDCVITEVATGEDAFEKIHEEYFDVVFFDNKLAKADGIEIIKQIRLQKMAIGQIFLLTGYPEEDTKAQAKKLGVFHFQSKKDMELAQIRERFKDAITDERLQEWVGQ